MKDFLKTNVGKTIKVAVWLAVSAFVGQLVAATMNDPNLFGPVTGLVNVVLVFVQKTWFSPSTPNLSLK